MLNTIDSKMAAQWWHHGVCVVCAMQTRFAKRHYRRFDEGQSTKVCCNRNMLKQIIVGGYLERTALAIDRSGGRVDGMEWCGLG